jgi:uncharacterized protein (DUF2267 family)
MHDDDVTHAQECTGTIIQVLKEKLNEEELDMLAASIAYDTQGLHSEFENGPHQKKCELEFNKKNP